MSTGVSAGLVSSMAPVELGHVGHVLSGALVKASWSMHHSPQMNNWG